MSLKKTVLAALCGAALAIGPAQAKVVSMASTAAPPSLGNPYTAVGQPSWPAIFDSFTVIGSDGVLEPGLAVSWDAISPTTWRLKLREGVTFHNGEPFNAEAAAATLRFLMAPSSRRYVVAAELKNVDQIEIVDNYTIDLLMKKPDAVLPKRLNLVFVVEPKSWAELGPEGFGLAPIGSGPFRLEDWGQTTGRIILKAVESGSYRLSKEVSEVDIVTLSDQAGRLQALLSGRVEIAGFISPDDTGQLEANGYKISANPQAIIMSIAFRTEREEDAPLKDVRVRQALNYAVNKEVIAEVIMGGRVEAASQGVPKGVFGYNPDLEGYPYNPEKARALLAEAGYADGLNLTIEAMVGMTPNDSLMYTQMVQDLARVGVNANLRGIPFSNFVGKYVSGNWGSVDAFGLTWNAAPFNDAIRPMEYFSCNKLGAFFCEPSLVPLIEASNQELDPAKRGVMVQDLMRQYNELAPSLLLISQTNLFALSPELENFSTKFAYVVFEELTFAD